MSDWVDDSRGRRDGVTLPTIWVAMALSLLLHVAVLWPWRPQLRLLSLHNPERGPASATLAVRLAPQASLPSSPPPAAPSPPALRAPASPPRRARRPAVHRATPPVIALQRPAPDTRSPPPTTQSTAVPAPSPAEGDLTSYIEAKRRARAASAPAAPGSEANTPTAEDDNAHRNRVVAANLGLGRAPTFGGDPSHSGGIFQIKRIGYSDAEFLFFGWNKDIRRNTNQLIEVRKGDNSDIRIAVVRKMIAIIRQYESGDFLWESQRLDRDITLSARAEDNAGLEEFMMREFFDATRPQ